MTTLPVMAAGMLGIFIVIGAIIASVYLLARVTRNSGKDSGIQ